jgi:hypothetical protein
VARPGPVIRVVIVVGAVTCLGLAMCARSKPVPQAPAQVQPGDASAPADAPQAEEPREHFPATKAPPRLY